MGEVLGYGMRFDLPCEVIAVGEDVETRSRCIAFYPAIPVAGIVALQAYVLVQQHH